MAVGGSNSSHLSSCLGWLAVAAPGWLAGWLDVMCAAGARLSIDGAFAFTHAHHHPDHIRVPIIRVKEKRLLAALLFLFIIV